MQPSTAPRIATEQEIRDVVVAQPRAGLPDLIERALAESGALLRGHFSLQVGKHTEYFIRFRALARDEQVLAAVARHLLSTVTVPDDAIVLVPESAGYFLGEAIRAHAGGNVTLAVARTDIARRPARSLLHGLLPAGRPVIVVNDVVTTGASLEPLLDLVADQGGTIAAALVFGALDGTGFRAMLSRRRIAGDHLIEAGPGWAVTDPALCAACAAGGPPVMPAAELN
jgi:orotate phosphoribosyltransferase